MPERKRVLTGDRPTGKLHLGHYVGSLANRIALQDEHDLFLLVANLHALTTKTDTANQLENIHTLVLDQLAAGIDPEKATFYLQSDVPEIAELGVILSMLVTHSMATNVPTLKEVLRDLNIESPSMGLIVYPVLMAADILIGKAHVVPVGKDQTSHLELAREVARRFNTTYGDMFPVPEALIPKDSGTLPGLDGKAKMSKSLGNDIKLSDDPATVEAKVMEMYTDPNHVHVNDPGSVEGNVVFTFLDIFDVNKAEVADLKEHYRKGGLGDVVIKKRLAAVLNEFLEPMRARRAELEKNPDQIKEVLRAGTEKMRLIARATLEEVKEKMRINYLA
ncbi:MAG: tryptophan--tRNA ligase [Patescibacteria group bacterium]